MKKRNCFHETRMKKYDILLSSERKAIKMLENILLVIAVLVLSFFSIKGIIYLVTSYHDIDRYSKDEEKKASNYEDYQYCDKLKY
jgi:hypothetical protein